MKIKNSLTEEGKKDIIQRLRDSINRNMSERDSKKFTQEEIDVIASLIVGKLDKLNTATSILVCAMKTEFIDLIDNKKLKSYVIRSVHTSVISTILNILLETVFPLDRMDVINGLKSFDIKKDNIFFKGSDDNKPPNYIG